MTSLRLLASFALLAALILAPSTARSDEKAPPGKESGATVTSPAAAETSAEVPALDAFHEVIRTIWHEAWPNKDAKTLRSLLPEVRDGAKAVGEATLPGILRDKRDAWSKGVKDLQSSVAEYGSACEGADDQKLLDAAERLHARYESLVRVIRPAMPELDAFHVVLYQLYHYDMPSDDLDAMRKTIDRLEQPLAALNGASVPKRLKNKEKEFLNARSELSAAVEQLVWGARSDDGKRIKDLIEEVHDRYQAAVAICE